jgi:hypothetical protein
MHDENHKMELIEEEAIERYSELLDELFPIVTLGSLEFNPSRIIKELDPIAFKTMMLEWEDRENIEIV